MINYKFNQYKVSGEKAQTWSPMAYRLLNKNTLSETLNGFRIGHILYLHHVKEMTAQEIRKTAVGYGLATPTIRAVLRGFNSKNRAGVESLEAYDIAMYMVENEPEVLEQMYKLTEYKM